MAMTRAILVADGRHQRHLAGGRHAALVVGLVQKGFHAFHDADSPDRSRDGPHT